MYHFSGPRASLNPPLLFELSLPRLCRPRGVDAPGEPMPDRPIGDETPGDRLWECRWLDAAAAAAAATAEVAEVGGGEEVGFMAVEALAFVAIERGFDEADTVAVDVLVETWAVAESVEGPVEPGDDGDEGAL